MPQKIVAGNWKMNLNASEGMALISDIKAYCDQHDAGDTLVIMAPPTLYLTEAEARVKGSSVIIAAQNCHSEQSGAYTGEISASMLKASGIEWAIIGHSERRQYFHEDGPFLNAKLKQCFEQGVRPILCVGEVLDDRKAGRQEEVVKLQLEEALREIPDSNLGDLVIAYEPVWAIGTGETASPEQAQEMHAFIRSWLKESFGVNLADAVSILYGGSVKPDNAESIFGKPDVDGGLIGGASLKADSFTELIRIGSATL
jgi:triosephosphate isomerase